MKEFKDDQQMEFSTFVRTELEKTNLYQREIAEKLGISVDAISQAVRLKNLESSRYNGTRRNILKALGFEVVTKITKKI